MSVRAQQVDPDPKTDRQEIPDAYFSGSLRQTQQVDDDLCRQTSRYLNKLQQLDNKILGRIGAIDSSVNNRVAPGHYSAYIAMLSNPVSSSSQATMTYIPRLDSLRTAVTFLQTQGKSVNALSQAGGKLSNLSAQVQTLQTHLNQSAQISQYLQQRQQQLTALCSQYTHLPSGILQAFSRYKTEGYYYKQQVEQYKNALKDPQKMESLAFSVLSRQPAYQQFFARHSLLAGLFGTPESSGGQATQALAGLQKVTDVQSRLQQQTSSASPANTQAMQGQMQAARNEFNTLKDRVAKYGTGGQQVDMPDFSPNTQRTKSFRSRLEPGFNFQFGPSTLLLPATANIGLSLGYKLNQNSTAGIGLSYNLGLGNGWNSIALSNQGLSLRSFMDWRIKKSYFITGGWEETYMAQFQDIKQLENKSYWQPSALIGLEKKYKISNKLQGSLQILFDALYLQDVPQGQPLKFRLGYNF